MRSVVAGQGRLAKIALLAVPALVVALLVWCGSGRLKQTASSTTTNAASAVQRVDPRLILIPRTVTLPATIGDISMTMTVGPLLPGQNHLALQLSDGKRPLVGASSRLVVRMVGMSMPPQKVQLRELQPGRYAATGLLAMFGSWHLDVEISRPGAAILRHQFTVSIDVPGMWTLQHSPEGRVSP